MHFYQHDAWMQHQWLCYWRWIYVLDSNKASISHESSIWGQGLEQQKEIFKRGEAMSTHPIPPPPPPLTPSFLHVTLMAYISVCSRRLISPITGTLLSNTFWTLGLWTMWVTGGLQVGFVGKWWCRIISRCTRNVRCGNMKSNTRVCNTLLRWTHFE